MKEMIKQKMMKKLHRRNSSSSSTASIDYSSGERVEFKFSGLQALQLPKGWDKLSLSLISVETGKTIAKTGRALAQNGNCRWTESLSESICVPHDGASKEPEQCLYKLLISMGSSRSGILGEVTVNLSGHLNSDTSICIAQPLENCSYGTILQMEIQSLPPRANLRWRDTDSFTEDTNASDDFDNTSDVSDGRITKSIGSSTSSNFLDTSQACELGSRVSLHSFDSMDDSFGRGSCSPRSNPSEVANDLTGRHDSVGSSNSASYSSDHVYDYPRSRNSPYSSGSGKHMLSQRQDSGKVSHSVPASPLRSGSSEFLLGAEGATVEELRAEARMWERDARKLMVDLDFSRKEARDQTKDLENVTMEVLGLQTECDGLKHEISYLKVLVDESAVKEKAADNLKLQVQDKDDIQTELEEEMKFQRKLNDDLSLQLSKTQESNLELVSVLQELEETIEKQRLEIESLSALKLQDVDTRMACKHEDSGEVHTREQVSTKKIRAVSCDSDYIDNSIENPTTDIMNDQSNQELQVQQLLESQKTLECTILYLEKTLEERTREIELAQVLKTHNESEWKKKLSLKDEEIFSLEEKLSEALATQVPRETVSHPKETPDSIEEVKALKDKIQELERDCNELTDENLELLFKLKESSKDLSTSVISISSSLRGHPDSNLPSNEDSEMIKLEGQIRQLKEEAKKRELDGIASGYLQIRCDDLERKCKELTVEMQGFTDKACSLDDELSKYHAKVEEQENEIAALKQLLKLWPEGTHENSFTQDEQAEVILDNVVPLNRSTGNFHMPKGKIQCGEEIRPTMKDPCNVENEMGRSLKDDSDKLERLNMELKSMVEDLGKELLAKTSEIEMLKSDCLSKDEEIRSQRCCQKDLETQLSELQILKSQLTRSLKVMQSESTILSECLVKVKSDMVVLTGTKNSQISANKILERKVLELESCNKELELHLAELEEENLHLSERISGLEPQLRYLTDARESSRLEMHHSETHVVNLQAEMRRLEHEIETSKVDIRQKLQEMQKRWLEAQEECEYLKKVNPRLQATAESLIEECASLQKSNGELRQQRLGLHNRCTALEAELRGSHHNFSKLSRNLEDLEDKFSLMISGIATKEKMFDSELEALHLQNKEQTEKLVIGESLLNQMYSDKMVLIENLQQEVARLSTQISATREERDRMSSEAVLEMHILRADKDKLETAIEDVKERFRSAEKKLDTVQVEYEARILELTGELAASKQNHGVLAANLAKAKELLESSRSSEENLRIMVGELDGNLKHCEYQRVQLTEEISSLKGQLQKLPLLQDEVVALKNTLNDMKYENERLEASLQLITEDYEELKEEKTSWSDKMSSMQKAVVELENLNRAKVALEERIMRLQGDLTARDALCAQDAELKNELGRLKRSNSHLQRKINCLQEEKDECMKNAQTLEEKLQQMKGLEPDETESSTDNSAISFGSDITSGFHEHGKLSKDVEARTVDETKADAASRIRSLESELAEALEANEAIKNKEHETNASLLEVELRELQERYLHMSLKYAEVEAQREELVLKLKAVGPGKSWFS